MLMAISLAEKLGGRGLLSFSVHPGLIVGTGLSSHLDLNDAIADLSTYYSMS